MKEEGGGTREEGRERRGKSRGNCLMDTMHTYLAEGQNWERLLIPWRLRGDGNDVEKTEEEEELTVLY